jgi:hypothetical protein
MKSAGYMSQRHAERRTFLCIIGTRGGNLYHPLAGSSRDPASENLTFRATIANVAERSVRSRSAAARDILASWFAGRLIIVGTAALGFIATFVIIRNQIASLKDALLPLLAFVPVYLFLIFLNMVWSARVVSRFGHPAIRSSATMRRIRVGVMAVVGLAFGVLAALWYVHTVAK